MGAGFGLVNRLVRRCVVVLCRRPRQFALWPPRLPALLRRAHRAFSEPKFGSISVTGNK
jgi:hypothetical protein